MALGDMLWSDVWAGFHRTQAHAKDGNLNLSWYALKGRSYQVQYTPVLSRADWTNLGDPVVASDYTVSVSDSLGAAPRRFYRTLLVP